MNHTCKRTKASFLQGYLDETPPFKIKPWSPSVPPLPPTPGQACSNYPSSHVAIKSKAVYFPWETSERSRMRIPAKCPVDFLQEKVCGGVENEIFFTPPCARHWSGATHTPPGEAVSRAQAAPRALLRNLGNGQRRWET